MSTRGHVHFLGIGGAGMSALAHLLLARGSTVSGCDIRASDATRRLRALGGIIHDGHDPAHLDGVDLVVVTRAVREDHGEQAAARRRGLPVRHRAELLGEVMGEGRSIGVVGTHGKTTTTAMTAAVLAAGGLDPTALIGADVAGFDGNVRVGQSEWMVAEVDESDGSLLHVRPWGAVVTSLDHTDHADFYESADHLEETFRQFLRGVPPDGVIVLNADHRAVAALAEAAVAPTGEGPALTTYGLERAADLTADVDDLQEGRSRATVRLHGQTLGILTLSVPGRYNVANALAATAAGLAAGIPFDAAAAALSTFHGISRRFEVRGDVRGILVVDDYAHNPVKVATVLRAAREAWPRRRLVAVFQPHRFTRTQTTYAHFTDAFADADELYITDLYAADEPPIPGVSAALIVDAVRSRRAVRHVPSRTEAAQQVVARAQPGDLILTLGAGDIHLAADEIVAGLRQRATVSRSSAPSGGRS